MKGARVTAAVLTVLLALTASWPGSMVVVVEAAEPVSLEGQKSTKPEFLRESIRKNDAYFTNDQLEAYLKDYVERCAHLSRLFSIGKSASRQRELWVLEISNRPGELEAKPYVKFVANMHGNEPTGRQILLQWAEWMCSAYQTDPAVTRMVDGFHVMLLPSMNPDGFDRHSRLNSENQDLNRNFPDPIQKMGWKGWANDLPPTGKECAETLAVMQWTTAHRFTASVSMHEGAVVANYPWDGSLDKRTHYSACPDDKVFRHLALLYASYNPGMRASRSFSNGVTNGAQWYPLWGGMQDWNYLQSGCLELTLELSNDKWPSTRELPRLWADNRQSLLAYANAAAYGGAWGTVAKTDGLPLEATISVQGISKDMSTGPLGDFYRPLAPGTYTVTASAYGYKAHSKEATVPRDNSGVKLEFLLLPEVGEVVPPLQPKPRTTDVHLPAQQSVQMMSRSGAMGSLSAVTSELESHLHQGLYRSKSIHSGGTESAKRSLPPAPPTRRLLGKISSTYLLILAGILALVILSWRRTRKPRSSGRRHTGSSFLP
mmetsp:Transcript_4573/g.8325  ORF Transcript_4573/g.8325 Transcript_4573/m.8325 type:complete len:544 (-) Transcript_4573:1669-3300(-)